MGDNGHISVLSRGVLCYVKRALIMGGPLDMGCIFLSVPDARVYAQSCFLRFER
jgi:hypothetical protein